MSIRYITRFGAVYRGSYVSAHVLLNLLDKLRKRDLSHFRNEFNKCNYTGARMLGSIYHNFH